MGSAGGEALPGDRWPARGVAVGGRPRDAVHQGHRPPVQRAVMGGAAVPGPQPVLVPRRQCRRAEGPATSRSRGPRRQPAARRHHREGRNPRRADGRRTGHVARPVDHPAAGDVRPRGDRRRPRGPGRRGVRRLRGAEDGADREDLHRRAGRSQFEDRELPGLPDWAFPAPSSPRRPAARPRSSAPRSSPPRRQASSSVNGVGAAHSIQLNDDNTIGARAVILATGVDYRQLQITGCWDDPDDPSCNYIGRGVYYGASVSDNTRVRGRGRLHRRRRELGRARPRCTCRRRPSR